MSATQVLQRISAWREGRPLPRGKAFAWPRGTDADTLVLAFVRMAGESTAWGVAVGPPDAKEPHLITCPEPRNVDALARLGLALWEHLKPHLPFPGTVELGDDEVPAEKKREALRAVARVRQLWVPGPTHLSMLHFLDFRFTPARTGDPESVRALNALGRACGWLFRESTRPGQVRVFDATRRLRETFAFPTEDLRQQHLGFLLAWLEDGSREERIGKARAAEALPASITLEPQLERDQLAPLVEKWNTLKEKPEEAARVAKAIEAVLRPELLRRWRHCVTARALLQADARPDNPELEKVRALGEDEFEYQYWRREARGAASLNDGEGDRFVGNHPESDFHPSAAAARYFMHLHAAELTLSELVHGDPDLIEEAIAAGEAVRGRITRVTDEGKASGKGRAMLPFWTVEALAEGPLRLREDSEVCVAGLRGRTGSIRTLTTENGVRRLLVEIEGWKKARPEEGAPAANDAKTLEGQEVVLLAAGVVGLSKQKSFSVWDGNGPGAWLTHAAPRPETSGRKSPPGSLVKLVETLGGK